MSDIEKGDVIQLAPEAGGWGPVFAVVDEVRAWGVIAMMYVPEARVTEDGGGGPGVAPIRLKSEQFVRIGKAEWTIECKPT